MGFQDAESFAEALLQIRNLIDQFFEQLGGRFDVSGLFLAQLVKVRPQGLHRGGMLVVLLVLRGLSGRLDPRGQFIDRVEVSFRDLCDLVQPVGGNPSLIGRRGGGPHQSLEGVLPFGKLLILRPCVIRDERGESKSNRDTGADYDADNARRGWR